MAVTTRNYDKEAKQLIKELNKNQKYELFEIVLQQLQRRSSDDRTRELEAVKHAIEMDRSLDKTRLKKMITGDTGMSADITNGSLTSNKKINRKKS